MDFLKEINKITADYAANRNKDQIIWQSMTYDQRIDKLMGICKDVSLCEKYAEKENLHYIPEPYFTQLMNNL